MNDTGTIPLEAASDPDPAPKDTDESRAIVMGLAKLLPFDYELRRESEAKRLGVRVSALDKAVHSARTSQIREHDDEVVETLEPWGNPVDGSILDEIRDDFERFVVAPAECKDALSVWALGTYCYDSFVIFPKLFLSSPERRCGKTVTLEALEANSCRALMASSITASAVFRAVNEWRPTLMVDEADRLPKDSEELIGIINAGHRKRSAFVIRSVKVADEFVPKKFSVWSPMVIAAIGRLADTVMDRSIIVHMERKAPGERAEKIPVDLFERTKERRQRCLRWGIDNMDRLRSAHVQMPSHGNDRAVDNWLPIFAIASLVGGTWPSRVTAAFAKLTHDETEESIGPMLLSDIRRVFAEKERDRLFSKDLVETLVAMEDRPWGEWRKGRPMTQNSLARLLDPYKVHAKTVRVGQLTAKGYDLSRLSAVFRRYLPPDRNVTTSQPCNGAAFSEKEAVTFSGNVTERNCTKPSNGAACDGVTVRNVTYARDAEDF